jgi:Zn-finger nucleic acid-binding protein
MNCPRCSVPLATKTYEADVAVDACPKCGGLWLERGELTRIAEVVERDYSDKLVEPDYTADESFELARQKSRPDIRCPKCGDETSKSECRWGSLVLMDVCASCGGMWLDRGEVQTLEIFFERMRQEEREDARRGLFAVLSRVFD